MEGGEGDVLLRSFLDSLGDARAGKRRVSVFFLRGLFAYDEEGCVKRFGGYSLDICPSFAQ